MTAARSIERFFQFSLLGLVASGFFALAGAHYLDRPTLVLTFSALVVRALMVAGRLKFEISPGAVSAAALAYLAFYPLDFYFLSHDFFTATLHGICFLAAVKILTGKTRRDYFYTGAVAFIQLVGAALLSFSPIFFLWLGLYILFTIAAFTSAEISRGLGRNTHVVCAPKTATSWRLTVLSISATSAILGLTILLFLTVPRTARVAAAMLLPGMAHVTGYSNVVDLGAFGQIGKDNRPVMHVLPYSRALPQHLKWRGTAVSRFDGRRWSEPPLPGTEVPLRHGTAEVAGVLQRSRRDGRRLLYRVDVNNSDTGTLFIAGIPEYLNLSATRLVRTPEDSFRVLPVTGEQLQYEVSALSGPPLPIDIPVGTRYRYLQLPAVDARIWKLAGDWSRGADLFGSALRIEHHLRTDFTYVLDSGSTRVEDPLANFLFVTKRGYCEYFASSMAVMLRTLGIPSRVVTGFQSGYFNDVSGMYVVRASDAHAWVEGWFQERGWVTFDPTPVGVAPTPGLLSRMNMYFDAADSTWQQWVVAYDLGHQANLVARLSGRMHGWDLRGDRLPGIPGLKVWALGAMAIIMFFVLRSRFARGSRTAHPARAGSDAALLYTQMLTTMSKRGFEKPAWFTPLEFASSVPAVAEFTRVYNQARFGAIPEAVPELNRLLKELF